MTNEYIDPVKGEGVRSGKTPQKNEWRAGRPGQSRIIMTTEDRRTRPHTSA